MKILRLVVVAIVTLIAFPVVAQDKPASTMEALREKLKADKKLVVAENMQLTESEAKDFWPVYEAYQIDLGKINAHLGQLIKRYAEDYRTNTLTDDKAKGLMDEALAIEKAEVGLKRSYQPKLAAVLPGRKVARYLQIENKIRAVIKYQLADGIPLAR